MNNNNYIKYRGTWVLYALGLVGLIMQLPIALSLTLAFFRGLGPSLWTLFFPWAYVLIVLVSVYAGVYWIIHKEGANFSLIVGFLDSYASYLILSVLLGYLYTSLILGL